MKKCDCYHVQSKTKYTYNPITGDPIKHDIEIGVCWGTKETDECDCGGDETKCDFYPEVREKALKKQEPKFGGWISVKDKLPEVKNNRTEFLCRCILDGDNKEECAYYLVLKWYIYDVEDGMVCVNPHFQDDGYNGMSVTHWMPLPEPPKGDKNDR